MLANIEARRMSCTMTEDLEELDYMRENGREGMGEGGSVESTMLVFFNENTLFHVLCRKHTISHFLENTLVHFMNIKYIRTYI